MRTLRAAAAVGRAAVLVAVAGAGARAQEPPQDAAATRRALASAEPAAVAWGAHFAREARDRALVAPLLGALARWRGGTIDQRTVCAHVLDALVGLDAPIPGDELLPFLDDPECAVAAFVLLARAPAHNEQHLLALLRRKLPRVRDDAPLPPQLVAIGDLLAAQRAPGLAPLLVARATAAVEIVVGDRPPAKPVLLGLAPRRAPAPGWPPFPNYRFEEAGVVAGGAWTRVPLPAAVRGTVVHQATTAAGARVPVSLSVDRRDPPERWPEMEWLCALAGEAAPARTLHHTFRDHDAFVAAVRDALAARERLLASLRERLVAAGALEPTDAAGLARAVELHVVDERADPAAPLPAIRPTGR